MRPLFVCGRPVQLGLVPPWGHAVTLTGALPCAGTFSLAPKNYTGFIALLPVMALVALSALAGLYMCCLGAASPPCLNKKCSGGVPVAPVAGRVSRQPAHPIHVLRRAR